MLLISKITLFVENQIVGRIRLLIKRLRNSLKFKTFFFSTKNFNLPKSIIYKNQNREFIFPDDDREIKNVFIDIFLDDSYSLLQNENKYKTVIDIGGNIGLTSLLIHLLNKNAEIHLYEPNIKLLKYLDKNLKGTNIKIFNNAVGDKEGMVKFDSVEIGSIHCKTLPDVRGDIKQVSFASCVDKFDQEIDLLKMDCEGAEWSILKDRESLRRVKNISMEYHLFNNNTLDDMKALIDSAGFSIKKIEEHGKFGMILAERVNYSL